MTSHDFAHKLEEVVKLLMTSKEFELPDYMDNFTKNYGVGNISFHTDKNKFIAAAKALGSGRKEVDDREYHFLVLDGLFRLIVDRDAVCRLVKPAVPAKYECEPLLSQEEEARLTS